MADNMRQLNIARPERDWSLADLVYERILTRIVDGEFPLNTKLPAEKVLSEEMGVSRPVLREALQQLREDGVIFSRQGSGSYVQRQPDKAVLQFAPVGSIADIQRNFEFRAVIESEAAGFAAQRWTEATLARIHAAFKALEACIDKGQLGDDEDSQLHLAISAAAENDYFYNTVHSMKSQTLKGMNLARNLSLAKPEARLRVVQNEHREVIDAIEARSADTARLAMRKHIENARQRVFDGAQTA